MCAIAVAFTCTGWLSSTMSIGNFGCETSAAPGCAKRELITLRKLNATMFRRADGSDTELLPTHAQATASETETQPADALPDALPDAQGKELEISLHTVDETAASESLHIVDSTTAGETADELMMTESDTNGPMDSSCSARQSLDVNCVVCMENRRDVVFGQCGHGCCCRSCAPKVTSCPLCREVVTSLLEFVECRTGDIVVVAPMN